MENINVHRLEREMRNAFEADKKYSRENDAKFRAIHQRVATYEEFRDIVKASHLSPLDRKEMVDGPRKQPWNAVALQSARDFRTRRAIRFSAKSLDQTVEQQSGGGSGRDLMCPGEAVLSSSSSVNPRSAQEFVREWRRLKQDTLRQYRLMLDIGGETLYSFFKVELGTMLGEMLLVLNEHLREPEDNQAVSAILSSFTRTSRFKLTVGLLSKRERKAADELLAKLGSFHSCELYSD